MNSNIRARVAGAVTDTLGRPVGVLPIDPRPKARRKTSSGSGVKRVGSHHSLSRSSSLTSNKLDLTENENLQSISQHQQGSHRDKSPKPESSHQALPGDPLRNVSASSRHGSSRQGSSRANSSYRGSSRAGSGKKQIKASDDETEKDDRPKKIIEPDEILLMCQEQHFHKVFEINLHGEELTEIVDLEKFRKVRVVDLSCNSIRRIENLDFNVELKELKLYGNRITTIENLDNLKELCNLQLQHNKIKSIGRGLSALKKLRTLRLDSNHLLKLETSDLVSCVHLTVLDISSNMLDSLAAVNYLPNLEELYAANNRLRKVTDIHRCKKLQEVDLSSNKISDVSGLSGLTHLQILDLSNNQLTSMKSLGKLKNLEDLNISGNKVSEMDYFHEMIPRLQILTVCDNTIVSWDQVCYLESLHNLVEVSLSGNPVTAEDGEMPHYHIAIQAVLPNIEVVDGAHVKRQSIKSAPLMRPMSASSIISVRQMDTQLKAYSEEFRSLEKSISDKFESLRATCDTLPVSAPMSRPQSAFSISSPLSSPCVSRPTSKSSSRTRLREAMDFAAQNTVT